MEKNYNRILLLSTIGTAILLASIILAINVHKSLDDPATCNLCHKMKPYVASYLAPQQGSAISKHKLTCIECHSNTSILEAREAVLDEIEVGVFTRITGVDLKTTSPALATNCTRCHFVDELHIPNSTMNTSCQECHWAHIKPEKGIKDASTLSKSAILYGPHTNQTCENCHGTTFSIPRCINCHTGHGDQKLKNSLCLTCHTDPHIPIIPGIQPDNTVNFTADLPFSICRPCHENEYSNITNIYSLHTEMQTCALCHTNHGEKPRCGKCHTGMMIDRHTDFECQDCHRTFPTQITCPDCHGRSHEWSPFTAILNPR